MSVTLRGTPESESVGPSGATGQSISHTASMNLVHQESAMQPASAAVCDRRVSLAFILVGQAGRWLDTSRPGVYRSHMLTAGC